MVAIAQQRLISANDQRGFSAKIDAYFDNLKRWEESLEPKTTEDKTIPEPLPRKRRTGFRRRMKTTNSMWKTTMLMTAASHSFADITKCRYLRGNHSDIDFDQFDSKETLAIHRNKIISRIPESDSDAEEDEKSKTVKSESFLPVRTADIIGQLNIKIDAIL